MTVTVSVLRGHERKCSLCHACVSKGVLVQNAGPMHLLLCRRCARRIGVVSVMLEPPRMPAIAKTKAALNNRKPERDPQ